MVDQSPSGEDNLRAQLIRLLQVVEVSGRAVLPRVDQDLLQAIIEAAARIFGAAAASLALVDEAQQMLEFKVSYGEGSEKVVGLRIPLDHGLAGYVVMTGQPIAVQNVQQDPRFNQDFAKSTGYVPRSILATPLFLGDRTIGVIEVLDKISAPSFGMQDIELLGLFARQAAIAIHQAQQLEHLKAALAAGLRRLALDQGSRTLLETLDEAEAAPVDGNLLAIADQVYALSLLGEAEQNACLDILEAFRKYSQSRNVFF